MISIGDLALAGKVNKTHGVKGELSISFFQDAVLDNLDKGDCLIMDMDGIFTPFFVASVRPRSSESLLVALDDIASQEQAAQFVGKNVYLLAAEWELEDEEEAEGDGFYAGQLIGYKALHDDGSEIGEIVDLDESTENVLFLVQTPKGIEYIPVADDFITDISTQNRTISFDLPEGLLQL